MRADPKAKRWLATGALYFGVWTLIGLSYAIQFYYASAKTGRPAQFQHALSVSLADWYCFALLAIPVILLTRRFPLIRRGWVAMVLLHLAFSLAFSFLYIVLRAFVSQWQALGAIAPPEFADAFNALLKTFSFNPFVYWVIVSLTQVISFYRELHERELRTRELEAGLTQARLHALQMQLNPHFLFNTLHTISALMHKDVNAADDMISHFSILLRQALENTGSHEVRLRDEVDFLKRYLQIEQTRFGERLKIEWEMPPETLDAFVPNLVLQPIVENAIQHGIEPHARRGIVHLSARRIDGKLELRVRDNGSGLPAGGSIDEGVGLSNTRQRLEQLYGAQQQFIFTKAPEGGLEVRVTLPFHSQPVSLMEKASS